MKLLYVFQQIILNDCVPHLMSLNGRLSVLNILPGKSRELTCAYRISKTGEHMIIKEWKKCMDICKEVLGSNIKRKVRIGDMIISILHNRVRGYLVFCYFTLENIVGPMRGVGHS